MTLATTLLKLIGGQSMAAGRQTAEEMQSSAMMGAVMEGSADDVRALAEKNVGINDVYSGQRTTPLIVAATTDQWPSAEVLIDHGADIWAHDRFGVTAAQMTVNSRILPGTSEDQARLRVIEKMKAQGYPFPPPDSDTVLQLEKEGKWPPSSARK
ncbi:ankyrin repeat domain-containing protein [Acetobacter sp. DsW_063]|uniref:ankyrin repeat domain-containing protein n=1 Tax=Acetobacter sp. DsW_063 TaxID=1514894 RepID=UPI001E2AB3A1|nr:ankyrin repeat domain-containing protein [Acetobacter sp. DsW_063]